LQFARDIWTNTWLAILSVHLCQSHHAQIRQGLSHPKASNKYEGILILHLF
jgi:hypothetical protein